ncbi:hypothetical protein HZH68_005160 [Vespula germanica]|uniref:Uncharacterized protein n=1 Tax=Vespula germanica TaxID=30212 RepID=A0A834KH66_VESGE|nr:hypothetical protein HZH68_005160 [Vespula germanica]
MGFEEKAKLPRAVRRFGIVVTRSLQALNFVLSFQRDVNAPAVASKKGDDGSVILGSESNTRRTKSLGTLPTNTSYSFVG